MLLGVFLLFQIDAYVFCQPFVFICPDPGAGVPIVTRTTPPSPVQSPDMAQNHPTHAHPQVVSTDTRKQS